MGKFLLGVLVGLILTVLVLLIGGLAMAKLFSPKQPSVAANSALILSLSGDVPEAAPIAIDIPFIQNQASPTVRDLWTSLHEAATDSRIKALVLEPRELLMGWARLEELRQEIAQFKKSGKPVYAFLQMPGSREYYLASVADKIFMTPDDVLDVKGFHLQEMYFKGTLDKLGIGVQVDHIGQYKDYGDMFTRTNMSPQTREVLSQVLDQIYGDFCSVTGSGRHKSADDMRTLIDMGPFLGDQAKATGLVDVLGYEDEVFADLKKKTGVSNLERTKIQNYYRATPGSGERLAMLVGSGDILPANASDSTDNTDTLSTTPFIKLVRQLRDDNGVKGVLLRVDSPGGDAIGSGQILHELKLLAQKKPVVISMSDYAASGGYYISMTGNPVFAYPNTLTGSIGVVLVRPNIHGLLDKVGVSTDALSRGKMSDIDNLTDPLSDAGQQKLHDMIASTYKTFVSKVATARKKSYDQIDALAQGRVWMGAQAQQNGLVDQLGGIDEAVALLRQRAHLSPNGKTNLVMYPRRKSLLEILTNSASDSSVDAAATAKLRKLVPGLPNPAILKGGLMELMPFTITIQ
ncbi:MAG TPA: signal peptide peptidase SppA [Bryobacteraceae bacterium]|jgi:protease-4|nr:signal peptide peptidase SppA [Bryobacteraceae bacterium]